MGKLGIGEVEVGIREGVDARKWKIEVRIGEGIESGKGE